MIALAAVALSLLLHAFGLSFSAGVRPTKTSEEGNSDVVTISNTFEDIAERLDETEPPEPESAPEPEPDEETVPEPEKAPEPEPEEETVPEPETAEAPTTEVLVASSNPQKTPAPDTGSAQVVRPDAAGPSALESGTVPEPETVQPAGGDDGQVSDAVTPPVEPDPIAETPQGTPDANTPPVEAIAAPPAPEVTAAPTTEQFAALPPAVAPAVPVTPVAPTPTPSAVPVIPVAPPTVDPETAEPAVVAPVTTETETPETTVDPESTQSVDGEDETSGSDRAIVSSLRPQLPTRRPPSEPEGQPDGTTTQDAAPQRPRLIESPLTAYRRDGTDLTIKRRGGTPSGGSGSQNFRGTGNSDVTNYAGRVFVHLNRAPAVRVVGRGYVRVFFEINPDGSVERIDIIESSGSVDIERAAKAQIRAAEPLPRPPNGNVRRMSLYYRPN